MRKGIVYLVGAGPGDPGLITVRGKECLERADCIIYDHLANEELLEYAPAHAEVIYAGKRGSQHALEQDEINALMIERAHSGKCVVRLKGGDPFIFGRGGEEAEELAASGIPFEIVPGVSSGHAAPAYAGIPLTHREFASSVAFITGHEDPTKEASTIAWDKLARSAATLVFFMGVKNLPLIAESLIRYGRSRHTPVAVIRWGTYPEQQTVVGTLGNIARIIRRKRIKPPAIVVVGQVVRLRERLNWFETKPLFGKRILVTRAREQSKGFARLLREQGAAVIEFPTIQISPPSSYESLDSAIARLSEYDWLIFTSANGVEAFRQRLVANSKDIRELKGLKIAAIGPATAEAVKRLHMNVDIVPSEYRAEGIISALASYNDAKLKGLKILIPRARLARDVLPKELGRLGARVDVVEAYETRLPHVDTSRIRKMLQVKDIHLVTFTSSSTVTNFAALLGAENLGELLDGVDIACIGPITAEAAAKLGLRPVIVPHEYTIAALAQSIVDFYSTYHRRHR